MATIRLPQDFKDFLRLLNEHKAKYLLIGGYAVGYYGYPRATADMDIWISMEPSNAEIIVTVLKEFGFNVPELSPELFIEKERIVRLGYPPMRIEITTTISGVTFEECYQNRIAGSIDDVAVSIIDLISLRINKKSSGRLKDLNDLENLP